MQNLKKVQQCSERIKNSLPQGFEPSVGIVLGTGLGGLASSLQEKVTVPYTSLPAFPASTVQSHQGQFSFGYITDVPVVMQQGRCHLYEGYSPNQVAMGTRVMATLGVKSMVITNAAGALNPQYSAGDLMLISDHINGTGQSPLVGFNHEEWGVRFPDMSQVYDKTYLELAKKEALELGIRLEQGVYMGIRGPELETPAETRAYRSLGADAIGMSTVLEVVAAKHLGLRVLAISCLTNKNLPDCMSPASIEEIINAAEGAGEKLTRLILKLTAKL